MIDPRHLQRIKIVQNLFAYSFNLKSKNLPDAGEIKIKLILKNLKKIDALIKKNAPRYPLEKIAKSDLAILRLGVYELVFDKKTPGKVVINEAVELAKELSGEKSYSFVNAVLGKIFTSLKNERLDQTVRKN